MAVTKKEVYLFIPNLIGYARVVTAVLLFVTMLLLPVATWFFYSTLCFLDAFDGAAARKYNQSTKFGAVLDMVTDRCTTLLLLIYLGIAYPRWMVPLQLLLSLDLALHYMHMYAMMSQGLALHKAVDELMNPLLRLYYTNKNVLFVVCFLNEMFFVGLYLAHFGYSTGTAMAVLSFPVWAFKQVTNVIQMVAAAETLVAEDVRERVEKK